MVPRQQPEQCDNSDYFSASYRSAPETLKAELAAEIQGIEVLELHVVLALPP